MGGGVTRIIAAVGVRGFATTVQYDLGNERRERALQRERARERLPDASRSIASNANGFVYGNAVSGSPYTTGANMNAGSGVAVRRTRRRATSSAGSTSRSRRATRSHLRAGAVDRAEHAAATAAAPPAASSASGQTNNGGTTWTYMHGLAGPAARRLRLRLSAELVRPGDRGRSEQPRPPLRRHV